MEKVRKILAKMLFCDVENVGNVLLHIPAGLVNAGIPVVLYLILGMPGALMGGLLAMAFALVFVAYETMEWQVIKDVIYPDLQGWLWGMGLGVGLTLVIYLCAP